GSVLMLLGILTLYFQHFHQFGFYSFEIADLMKLTLPLGMQQWVFWAFFIGFAIKVPMFPFHTWLPDAHVEAPTAGSVILAAGLPLLNGFIGEFTILQGVFEAQPIWAAFAVTGVILGAAYLLWLYQRTMLGQVTNGKNLTIPDMTLREVAIFVPLIAWSVWIG